MEARSMGFLISSPVTLLAGKTGVSCLVHEQVSTNSESPSLRALINGHWRKAEERKIDWLNFEVDTVHRVFQFLYTGDYDSPIPITRAQSSVCSSLDQESTARDSREVVEREVAPVIKSSDEDHEAISSSTPSRPLTPFDKCLCIRPVAIDKETTAGSFKSQSIPYKDFCYRAAIMAHAELYEFACYHTLDSLQELALGRQQMSMQRIDCSLSNAAVDLAGLTESVYDRTPEGEQKRSMRYLVSHFVALSSSMLLRPELLTLIHIGGDFAVDLTRNLSRRLLLSSEEYHGGGHGSQVKGAEKREWSAFIHRFSLGVNTPDIT